MIYRSFSNCLNDLDRSALDIFYSSTVITATPCICRDLEKLNKNSLIDVFEFVSDVFTGGVEYLLFEVDENEEEGSENEPTKHASLLDIPHIGIRNTIYVLGLFHVLQIWTTFEMDFDAKAKLSMDQIEEDPLLSAAMIGYMIYKTLYQRT